MRASSFAESESETAESETVGFTMFTVVLCMNVPTGGKMTSVGEGVGTLVNECAVEELFTRRLSVFYFFFE